MLIRRAPDIPSSEITDEKLYVRRREFMRLAGGAAAAAMAGPWFPGCAAEGTAADPSAEPAARGQMALAGYKTKVVTTDEKLNTFEEITGYNNFYEFGTGKERSAAVRRPAEDEPVDGEDRRALQQAGATTCSRI